LVDWIKSFEEWIESLPRVPYLPLKLLRRKYIYGGDGVALESGVSDSRKLGFESRHLHRKEVR